MREKGEKRSRSGGVKREREGAGQGGRRAGRTGWMLGAEVARGTSAPRSGRAVLTVLPAAGLWSRWSAAVRVSAVTTTNTGHGSFLGRNVLSWAVGWTH